MPAKSSSLGAGEGGSDGSESGKDMASNSRGAADMRERGRRWLQPEAFGPEPRGRNAAGGAALADPAEQGEALWERSSTGGLRHCNLAPRELWQGSP